MSWNIELPYLTSSIVGLDERADWLLGDNISDENSLVPLIVKIGTGDENDAELPSQLVGRLVEEGRIYVPSWYLNKAVDGLNYPEQGMEFIAYAPLSFFEFLASSMPDDADVDFKILRDARKTIRLCTPLPGAQPSIAQIADDKTTRTRVEVNALADPPPVSDSWPGDTVIMAIIDDGIGIANSRFQNYSGSRVEYFWRQDGPSVGNTVPTGSELTRQDINNLLTASSVAGVLDEDAFYSKAGLASFTETGAGHIGVNWRASHGTHVMDMAAGFQRAEDVSNRPIIAVQLPASTVENTSGVELDHHVYSAIDYILQRAEQISPDRALPLVINLSFGRYGGPHDGTSELEKYLDKKIAGRKNTKIVLPAGNSRQSRTHSRIEKSDFDVSEGEVQLSWRVQPDDRTQSFCQIWLPADSNSSPPSTDRIRLSVIAPNGDVSPEIGEVAPQGDLVYQIRGQNVFRVKHSFVEGDTSKSLFTLSMMPTSRNENILNGAPAQVVAPAGVWKLVIKDIGLDAAESVECWIERDDTAYGYRPAGRQSYFDDSQYERLDDTFRPYVFDPNNSSSAKRTGTLNGIATGVETIVVGAMYGKEKSVTDYSACGPASIPSGSSVPSRPGPDMLAVADDSKVHVGIAGAGTRSGSVVYLNGTSVAAPRVAREVANLMAAAEEEIDRGKLADIVIASELTMFSSGGYAGEECSGNGRWMLPHPHAPKPRIDSHRELHKAPVLV